MTPSIPNQEISPKSAVTGSPCYARHVSRAYPCRVPYSNFYFSQLMTSIECLDRSLDGLSIRRLATDGKLEAIEGPLNELSTRFDAIGETHEAIQGTFSGILTKFDAIDEKLDRILVLLGGNERGS